MNPESQTPRHAWSITVDSDRVTAIGAGLLFVVLCLWLARDIRGAFWDHFAGPTRINMNYWSISNAVLKGIAAVYGFILAFTFTQKYMRIACLLMGTKLACFVLLSCLNISSSINRIAAVSGSIISQIALIFFLVAIVQWFKSVIRWDRLPEPQGGNH